MNTPIFTCAKHFTKLSRHAVLVAAVLSAMLVASESARADWTIDFSRRASKTREQDLNAAARPAEGRNPASVRASDGEGAGGYAAPIELSAEAASAPAKKGVFDTLFDAGEPIQDIVILHTDKGFVPSTVRVRKGGRYKVTVVNVNEREKNVSFILDGFSEHHATYYGKVKTFTLEPKKEGTYSFQSPETSSEGKLVVFNPQVTLRAPASDE